MVYSNDKVKWLLKSELVKRGITTADLLFLLNQVGVNETQSSITSKISRGTFGATFFLQCLSVIGCTHIEVEGMQDTVKYVAETKVEYKTQI